MLRSVTSTEGTTRQGGSCSRCSVVRWRCAGRLRVTAVELAARGRRLRAAHERVVCRLVVCQPDFTQELPRKLLPTRAKEAQRRRREKHSFTRLSLWRLGSRVDLKRAHNPKVVGSNPAPATTRIAELGGGSDRLPPSALRELSETSKRQRLLSMA